MSLHCHNHNLSPHSKAYCHCPYKSIQKYSRCYFHPQTVGYRHCHTWYWYCWHRWSTEILRPIRPLRPSRDLHTVGTSPHTPVVWHWWPYRHTIYTSRNPASTNTSHKAWHELHLEWFDRSDTKDPFPDKLSRHHFVQSQGLWSTHPIYHRIYLPEEPVAGCHPRMLPWYKGHREKHESDKNSINHVMPRLPLS